MKIRSVRHKGLRRLIEKDDPAGLQPAAVDKIRKIIAFLQDMERVDELRTIPVWQAHQLSGNRKGRMEPVRNKELAHHFPRRRG